MKERMKERKRESQTEKQETETCRKQRLLQGDENTRKETIINLFRKVNKEMAFVSYEWHSVEEEQDKKYNI